MRQNVTLVAVAQRGRTLVAASVVRMALVVATVFLVAACSGESSTDAPETTTSTAPTTSTTTTSTTTTSTTTTTTVPESTTTTVAEEPDDGLTEEQTVLVEALLAAFNDRDLGAFVSLFGTSASLTSAVSLSPPSTGNPERIPIELTYRWAMSEAWELQDCRIQYGAIDCTLSVSDNLAGRDGPLQTKLSLLLDDQGAIAKMRLFEDEVALNQAAAGIYAWVEENHPEAIQPMWFQFASGVILPKLTDESIALRLELIPKYLASLDE